ncbi:MAG TPA: hypothetical protein DGN60_06595, partial [Chloroflexi bacterium]|nr:hypothetical protein [Chloroflexota bacterium]
IIGPYRTHGSNPTTGLAIAAEGGILICNSIQIGDGKPIKNIELYDLAIRWNGKSFDSSN